MSMFPIPEMMMPDMSKIEAINKEFATFVPYGAGFPMAVNLMIHPAGGLAAATALSMGVASQTLGIWMGAMAGSMEAARQLYGMKVPGMDAFGFGATWDDVDCDVDAAKPEPKSPVSRAKSAAKTLIADLESASADLAGAAGKVAGVATNRTATARPAKESKPVPPSPRVADEGPSAANARILPEDFKRPGSIEKPGNPDDLKRISGIGPKLEQVLNGLGVWTFAQVAGWTAEEIAWMDDYLAFGGRIERDGWLKQAAELRGTAG